MFILSSAEQADVPVCCNSSSVSNKVLCMIQACRQINALVLKPLDTSSNCC
jgi:hypothetical protein